MVVTIRHYWNRSWHDDYKRLKTTNDATKCLPSNNVMIDSHKAVGSFSALSRRLAHGVMMWSGLRTPGYVETPGNMTLLCLCLQALA